MNKQQKLLFFGIGVILGLMMVANILKGRADGKQESAKRDAGRMLPGLLVERAQQGAAVYPENGKGVLEEAVGPGAEGFAQVRRVLVGGRNRVDALNNPLPQEFITITEYYATEAKLTPETPVKRMDFAFADRIRVTVKEPAQTGLVYQTLKDLGAHLHPEPGSRTAVIARFDAPKLATVGEALTRLAGRPEVVTAEPVRIDWTKEVAK